MPAKKPSTFVEKPKKKYFYDEDVVEQRNDTDILQAISYSSNVEEKDPARKTKHWLVKSLETNDKLEFITFLTSITMESYLSRIIHAIYPSAPKSKIIDFSYGDASVNISSGSRLYPCDLVQEFLPNITNDYDLLHVLKKNENTQINLPGLLKSLVFRIIIEDWDNKLQNYTAYKTESADSVNNYLVAPFDFELALGFCGEYKKSWNISEISSLVHGSGTASEKTSVAEALAETIGELGARTTDYYMKFYEEEGVDNSLKKQTVTAELGRQLTMYKQDHGLALINVFEEVLGEIKSKKQAAHLSGFLDAYVKLNGVMQNEYLNYIQKRYVSCEKRLLTNVSKFDGFIGGIKESYVNKEHRTPDGLQSRCFLSNEAGISIPAFAVDIRVPVEHERQPRLASEAIPCIPLEYHHGFANEVRSSIPNAQAIRVKTNPIYPYFGIRITEKRKLPVDFVDSISARPPLAPHSRRRDAAMVPAPAASQRRVSNSADISWVSNVLNESYPDCTERK